MRHINEVHTKRRRFSESKRRNLMCIGGVGVEGTGELRRVYVGLTVSRLRFERRLSEINRIHK